MRQNKTSQPPKIKIATIRQKHVPDIYKQSLIIPGEWQGDKNIHKVLNNVLSDNNIHVETGQLGPPYGQLNHFLRTTRTNI